MVTRTGGSWVHEYTGLSADARPTQDENGNGIPNGSIFIEMNTGKIYFYDAEGEEWLEWGGSSPAPKKGGQY